MSRVCIVLARGVRDDGVDRHGIDPVRVQTAHSRVAPSPRLRPRRPRRQPLPSAGNVAAPDERPPVDPAAPAASPSSSRRSRRIARSVIPPSSISRYRARNPPSPKRAPRAEYGGGGGARRPAAVRIARSSGVARRGPSPVVGRPIRRRRTPAPFGPTSAGRRVDADPGRERRRALRGGRRPRRRYTVENRSLVVGACTPAPSGSGAVVGRRGGGGGGRARRPQRRRLGQPRRRRPPPVHPPPVAPLLPPPIPSFVALPSLTFLIPPPGREEG